MRILLDTHVFIWWDAKDPALSANLREAIADAANEIYVSAASVWEIAIKRQRGKIAFAQGIAEAVTRNRFLALPIAADHAEAAGGLPRHHGDPFDRILVAQTMIEQLTLGTQDALMRAYGIAVLGLEG